jgi:hypothetical protein
MVHTDHPVAVLAVVVELAIQVGVEEAITQTYRPKVLLREVWVDTKIRQCLALQPKQRAALVVAALELFTTIQRVVVVVVDIPVAAVATEPAPTHIKA